MDSLGQLTGFGVLAADFQEVDADDAPRMGVGLLLPCDEPLCGQAEGCARPDALIDGQGRAESEEAFTNAGGEFSCIQASDRPLLDAVGAQGVLCECLDLLRPGEQRIFRSGDEEFHVVIAQGLEAIGVQVGECGVEQIDGALMNRLAVGRDGGGEGNEGQAGEEERPGGQAELFGALRPGARGEDQSQAAHEHEAGPGALKEESIDQRWVGPVFQCSRPIGRSSDNNRVKARGFGARGADSRPDAERFYAAMGPLFEQNLAALSRNDPVLADRLRGERASEAVCFFPARREPVMAATLKAAGSDRPISLCSAQAPLAEARGFAEQVKLDEHAVVVVLGLGAGHHVRAVVEAVGDAGVVVVYEPDAGVVRAVLEQIDCTSWLSSEHLGLFIGEVDQGELTGRLERVMGQIAQGVQLLTHPATRQVHAEAIGAFGRKMTQLIAYCRTNVATTLVNSPVTCRNLSQNLGRYAAGATINELKGIARGRPAVLVAAGPSLAKNVHLLAQPGVRDRVVIITAQTTLKLLLDRGVRPHFVTALDFHEISRRFYEGLPELNDVTLIAEPKANRAILDSYPGPIRVCRSGFLDMLLGRGARMVESLPAGSTVAHLSFYFAQYLGCDPIGFIGQDLGFSDGLYYCPGTAMHEVWGPELGAYNTLEMMEWKRVAGFRGSLQKREDVHGRAIYSDEQMLTYLKQFERDFAVAPQKLIDATEGGLAKAHTQRMRLSEFLAEFMGEPVGELPLADRAMDDALLARAAEVLAGRQEEVRELGELSRGTVPLLEQMLEHQGEGSRMAGLFARLEKKQARVAELQQAFGLVQQLNQVGTFNRHRADRSIRADRESDAIGVQRRQLERDIENLKWLIQACDETLGVFGEASERLGAQIAQQSRMKEARA